MKIILPEIISIGFFNSVTSRRGVTVSKTRKTQHYEIEIPTEKGGVLYINDEHCPIEPNTIVCAPPNVSRHAKLHYKCYYVHLTAREGVITEILDCLPYFLKTENYDKYLEIFKRLVKHYDYAAQNSELIINGILLELIYNLYQEAKGNSHKSSVTSSISVIDDSVKYIKENLTADLSLEALSNRASFSPIYFHNRFKTSVGKTPREFVEEQRIKKAANLLVTTNMTLSEITYECGFSSQSYFSYAFKRKMKMTPRQYAHEVFKKYGE